MLFYGLYNIYMQINVSNMHIKSTFHSQEVDNINLFLASIFKRI